ESNATRKDFISNQVLKHDPKVVGIHRLTMKTDSDNSGQAAIFDIMKQIRAEVVIYEPSIGDNRFEGYHVVNDISEFKAITDGILANRISEDIKDVKGKVYTRDVYNNN